MGASEPKPQHRRGLAGSCSACGLRDPLGQGGYNPVNLGLRTAHRISGPGLARFFSIASMHSKINFPWCFALALGLLSARAAAQVTPYGSGINPAGSLELTAGSPLIGTSFQLSVRNTAVANPLPGQAFLSLSTQPAPGFPGGLPLPGLGLASPGAIGELLIDVLAPNPFLSLGPTAYLGGAAPGASFDLNVPFNPALIGLDLFAQGLLTTPSQGFSLGLTSGLKVTLGAPSGPIPGVTQIAGLAVIQAGSFQMGSNELFNFPYFGQPEEKPVRTVVISKPFWMGITEVSQAQYQTLMGTNPSVFVGPNNPVERVTWFDALAYCAALTAQQSALGNVPAGYHYRLPTEAEWEYACRAGTTTEFNVGVALLCSQANFWVSNVPFALCVAGAPKPAPVSSYPPNSWGLYDMHGNVSEWCLDVYGSYPAIAPADPFVASGGPYRVLRGGSWDAYSYNCRSAARRRDTPGSLGSLLGFRVVLAPVLIP